MNPATPALTNRRLDAFLDECHLGSLRCNNTSQHHFCTPRFPAMLEFPFL
jgi:hypothetical protein